MLQITVHDYRAVSRRAGKSREDGSLLSEVSGEMQAVYTRILARGFFDLLPGSVGGTIIYKNQFVFDFFTGQKVSQHRRRLREHLLLIVRRNYYR